MNYQGYFITLEGNEGSGKTTQIELLKPRLFERYGDQLVFGREPGGSRIAEDIREIIVSKDNDALVPMAELLLYEAARAQFCAEVLTPAFQAGKIVFCDRFYDSSYAYQGWGRGLSLKTVKQLNKIAVGYDIKPNLTLWLRVQPEVGRDRRMASGESNRMDLQRANFYDSVEQGYQYLSETEKRFVAIEPKSIEETHEEVWRITTKKIDAFLKGQKRK